MHLKRHIMILALIAASLCLFPRGADASFSGLISHAVQWWSERSLGSPDKVIKSDISLGSADGTEDVKGDEPPSAPTGDTNTGTSGMCQVPQAAPEIICDASAGFLCVNTPPGSVASDSFVIKGTIDRQNSAVASIRIVAQNEYTKKMASVDTSKPIDGDCWGRSPDGAPFCLGADGRFSATVPFLGKGPHTISVSASRLSGKSEEKRIRVSRVVELKFSDKDVKFDPDVRTAPSVDKGSVLVTVNLLSDCKFCDFIGASTAGVTVSVENVVRDSAGAETRIECKTRVEQGGQGQFVVGMPVMGGKNTLTVRACNAAVEKDGCPSVGGLSFDGKGGASALKVLSPPPQPTYDSAEYPVIRWDFALNDAPKCVKVKFNREAPREVCQDASGNYSVELHPKVGINIATIAKDGRVDEFAWTFGWGKAKSPFGKSAGVIEVPEAAAVAIGADMIKKTLIPLLNNFLKSDDLGVLIKNLFSPKGSSDKSGPVASGPAIPKCDNGAGFDGFLIAVNGTPTVESAEIKEPTFVDGKMSVAVALKGVRVRIDLAPDKNKDGIADKDPLPLLVSFKEATFHVDLVNTKDDSGNPLLLLGSPEDDCSFKRTNFCYHVPTSLTPKNFVGDANPLGSFVACDESVAGPAARDACSAINSLDVQTGAITEKMLDTINNAIYCSGSSKLTGMVREGIDFSNLKFGCRGEQGCEGKIASILAPTRLPLKIKLSKGAQISSSGIATAATLDVGSSDLYAKTPERYRIPSAGMIPEEKSGADPVSLISSMDGDVGASFFLDSIGALLYAGAAQGDGVKVPGLLDFDIDDDFLKEIGFDTAKECDGFKPSKEQEESPVICKIRPRVAELLGSALATYGYFSSKQPLRLAIRGNRALGSRLSIVDVKDVPIVLRGGEGESAGDSKDIPTGSIISLELGGLEFAFYALEIDKNREPDAYGNPQLKRDTEGKPVIHSMRPDLPDPLSGQIVSFDLTLLLAAEVGSIKPDPKDPSKLVISVRPLADRSRLVMVPLEGTNATTIPSLGLVSALDEKLKIAISNMSSKDNAINIPVPKDIAMEAGDPSSIFGALGLREISFGEKGPALNFDSQFDTVRIAIKTIVTQILHQGGKEIKFTLPVQ